jgi:hypothetical protein
MYKKKLKIKKKDCALLQQDVDNLAQWERDWLMEFNPSKCNIMRVTHKLSPIAQAYTHSKAINWK